MSTSTPARTWAVHHRVQRIGGEAPPLLVDESGGAGGAQQRLRQLVVKHGAAARGAGAAGPGACAAGAATCQDRTGQDKRGEEWWGGGRVRAWVGVVQGWLRDGDLSGVCREICMPGVCGVAFCSTGSKSTCVPGSVLLTLGAVMVTGPRRTTLG